MTLDDLRGKKIAIAGMGVNNKSLAEYLRGQGIEFDIVDGWKSSDDLIGKLDDYDIIFRTPGLPYLSKAIQQAKAKGVAIYSQTKLFFDLCPARIIGVTGTKGKGTTATLIFKILEAAGKKVWLAGNIGEDPFAFLDKIQKDDWVVLELSSFQLQDLHKSPHIAVVLKITPDHLDHHRSAAEYIDAKKNIVAHQTAGDFAVLNRDNETSKSFAKLTSGKVVWVSGEEIASSPGAPRNDSFEVGLLGKFNLENIAAAVAAVQCCGVSDQAVMRQVIKDFKGLPHRLQLVAEKNGVKFYDDSFSTTPETVMAALSAFDGPIILIAGGSEKNSNYMELARRIAESRVKGLLAIGRTGPAIAKLARGAGFKGRIVESGLDTMDKIVGMAKNLAVPGDVVLLSPGAASFDMFRDYKDRGEQYAKFVNQK